MNEDFKIELEKSDTSKLKHEVYTRIHYGNVIYGKKKSEQSIFPFKVLEVKQNNYYHVEVLFLDQHPKFECKMEILSKLKLNG